MVSPARPVVVQYAAETVQETERAGFIAAALEDINRLHDGILSRYRISRSEFARWRAGVACDEE
jgi:hypothetical protein